MCVCVCMCMCVHVHVCAYVCFVRARACVRVCVCMSAVDLATINNLAVLNEDCLHDEAEADKYYRRALELAVCPHI